MRHGISAITASTPKPARTKRPMWPQLKLLEVGHSEWGSSTKASRDSPIEQWDIPLLPPAKRAKLPAVWPQLELERDTGPEWQCGAGTMGAPIEPWSIPPLPTTVGDLPPVEEGAGNGFTGTSRPEDIPRPPELDLRRFVKRRRPSVRFRPSEISTLSGNAEIPRGYATPEVAPSCHPRASFSSLSLATAATPESSSSASSTLDAVSTVQAPPKLPSPPAHTLQAGTPSAVTFVSSTPKWFSPSIPSKCILAPIHRSNHAHEAGVAHKRSHEAREGNHSHEAGVAHDRDHSHEADPRKVDHSHEAHDANYSQDLIGRAVPLGGSGDPDDSQYANATGPDSALRSPASLVFANDISGPKSAESGSRSSTPPGGRPDDGYSFIHFLDEPHPSILRADLSTSLSLPASRAHSPLGDRSFVEAEVARKATPPPADDGTVLCFPYDGIGRVNITNADLVRLQPGEYLNDTLIEFGLKHWMKRLHDASPEIASQVHVCSSFFYKKLNKSDLQSGFRSVSKWTSRFDLFRKKYIIVPINEDLHWYLAIIFEPEHVLQPRRLVPKPRKPTYLPNHTYIFIFDSLGNTHDHACKQLSGFLSLEAAHKKAVTSTVEIMSRHVEVPRQPNFCDCGLYAIHFAETFIPDARNLIRRSFDATTPGERETLWQTWTVSTMRQRLRSVIEALSEEWMRMPDVATVGSDVEVGLVTHQRGVKGADVDFLEIADLEVEVGPVTGLRAGGNTEVEVIDISSDSGIEVVEV